MLETEKFSHPNKAFEMIATTENFSADIIYFERIVHIDEKVTFRWRESCFSLKYWL